MKKQTALKSVTIGTPHNGDFTAEYINSLFGMAFSTNAQIRLHLFESCLVHQARNKIADACRTDYLLFIDTDMAFPTSGLNRLMELDKDIVGGLYYSRKAPHMPHAYKLEDGVYKSISEIPTEPFACDAVATGFMLIKKEVFDEFEKAINEKRCRLPFDFESTETGELGEDIAFCKRAKELGFEIWCDPTFPIGHVAKDVITNNHFEAYREVEKQK